MLISILHDSSLFYFQLRNEASVITYISSIYYGNVREWSHSSDKALILQNLHVNSSPTSYGNTNTLGVLLLLLLLLLHSLMASCQMLHLLQVNFQKQRIIQSNTSLIRHMAKKYCKLAVFECGAVGSLLILQLWKALYFTSAQNITLCGTKCKYTITSLALRKK